MITRILSEADAEAFTALRIEGTDLFPEAFLLTMDEARAIPADRVAGSWPAAICTAFSMVRALSDLRGWSIAHGPQARHRAHLGPFYVTPAFQGRDTADRLMAHLEQVARDKGVQQIELWVAAENTRARAFYTRHGFRATGQMPGAVILEGCPRDDVFMLRQIDGPKPQKGGDGLRRLGPGDWRAFRECRLLALKTEPRAFGSTYKEWAAKAPDEVADWLRMLKIWGVVENGQVMAIAGWHPMSGAVQAHRGHVIAAFCRPEARGQGYFARIMEAITSEARAAGIVQLELDVGAENTLARAAYEKLGFVVTGSIPGALNHDGDIHDQLYMVRPL